MKQYKIKINGKEHTVEINSIAGNIADITINGRRCQAELSETAVIAESESDSPVYAAAPFPSVRASRKPEPSGREKSVTAPLPGVITAVNVKAGDKVKAGQAVIILEAMKMENEIQSEQDGTVTSVHVEKGESVLEGTVLISME